MRLAFVLALSITALSSVPARACWDGYQASTPHLYVMGPDDEWSLERAGQLARWMPRIEALLAPRGVEVAVYHDMVELSDGRVLSVPEGKLHRLFAVLARELAVPPAERRAAMRVRADARTIQVAATRDEAAARALADRLNAELLGAHGFYEAGGFPAENERAHVVEASDEEGVVYRVLVGAFLDRTEASRVAAELRAITGAAFLRPL